METVTINLTERVKRTGKKVPFTQFKETASTSTLSNLDTLSTKFGIKWNSAVVIEGKKWGATEEETDATRTTFTVVGKAADKEVFYDRDQLSLFFDSKRQKTITGTLKMRKDAWVRAISSKKEA